MPDASDAMIAVGALIAVIAVGALTDPRWAWLLLGALLVAAGLLKAG